MPAPTDDTPAQPSFAEMTSVFAKIGLLSFGGPAGQIAMMHRELVDERRWISEARFLHALNYCMLLPGPEAQQLATYIGWLLHGARGGIVAGTLFVIPGFIVIVALSAAYALFQQTAWLNAVFFGLKAAVLAVVIEATLRIARRALKTRFLVGVAACAFIALFVFAVPFPFVILAAGLVGIAGARLMPAGLALNRQAAAPLPDRAAVIDARIRGTEPAPRPLATLLGWGALWIAPFLAILALQGPSGPFAAIFTFFSTMAVVTFGGAYAVLAYVAQQAVETYGWLKPGEMLDGLALAETTPGPLVLVLTFVGFLAAFRNPGPLDPLLAGLLGATLTTWVTFVPCFLWIFLGAPWIERLRGNATLSAALTAITAAVVGVILNLALWFALHVLFRRVGSLSLGPVTMAWPDWSSFDPVAALLGGLAALMLLVWHQGMIRTLALCGLAGLAYSLI